MRDACACTREQRGKQAMGWPAGRRSCSEQRHGVHACAAGLCACWPPAVAPHPFAHAPFFTTPSLPQPNPLSAQSLARCMQEVALDAAGERLPFTRLLPFSPPPHPQHRVPRRRGGPGRRGGRGRRRQPFRGRRPIRRAVGCHSWGLAAGGAAPGAPTDVCQVGWVGVRWLGGGREQLHGALTQGKA